MNLEILKKYGLPTAFAAAAFTAFLWLVRSNQTDLRADVAAIAARLDRAEGPEGRLEKVRNDLDFLSRTVDLSCRPPKEDAAARRRRPTPP